MIGSPVVAGIAKEGVQVVIRPTRRWNATPGGHPPGIINTLMTSSRSSVKSIEVVEPLGDRVLVRKDEDRKVTKVGIHLPDKMEIPTLTGRIVAISAQVENDVDYPIQQYDKVLFNPKRSIPVDFEGDNRLFVIPVEDVVAVFRKED